jgi:hypothetical protein
MPIPTLRWLRRGLKIAPGARWAAQVWHSNRLCRVPGSGSAAKIEERLTALTHRVGFDRLPCGIRPDRLAGWLEEANQLIDTSKAPRRRVLLFSTMSHWVEYCVPLALALAGSGCLVDYVWAPYPCPDRDVPEDLLSNPRSGLWYLPPWVQIHPHVRLINLLHLPAGPINDDLRAIAWEGAHIDTQYVLRRETLDELDKDTQFMLGLRVERNLDCLARLGPWLEQVHYDSALVPNAAVYEFGVVHRCLSQRGVPSVSFDFGERKGYIYASDTVPCVCLDTSAHWEADAPHVLTPQREQRVMRFLLRREMPNWSDGDYIWSGQPGVPQAAKELYGQLGLDPDRPVALLCCNIAHDTAVLGANRTFESMAEWIVQTVLWFRRRPERQLVVRCHPAEAIWPSNEPIPELIRARCGELPESIHVIAPGDKVNTYGLMRLSTLGLIYTSTVGLEMAVRGYTVVTAGRVHYAGKGFTIDPVDPADYFARLEELTGSPEPLRLTRRQIELALCCADVYFFDYQRSLMWYSPGETDKDMALCSLGKVLRKECSIGCLDTLDFLAGHHLEKKAPPRRQAA